MRLGLCFDLRNPPNRRRAWADVYSWALDLAQQADEWGIDTIWTTEHHFFEDGYLPQPLTFAAAAAARTRTARVGTAILIAPLRAAVQIAEEAAIVDLISNGRLDLGLGAGYRAAEFEAFGADLTARHRTLERRVTEIRELYDGGMVVPPPAQQRLPIWLGHLTPVGARRAGLLGEGLLSLVPGTFDTYREGLVEAGHDPAEARVAGLVHAVVADDPDATWSRIGDHIAHQLHSYMVYGDVAGDGPPPRPDPAALRTAGATADAPGIFPNIVILTPPEAVELLRELHPSGAASVEAFFWASIGGMPEDVAERHVELLATQVRPLVVDW